MTRRWMSVPTLTLMGPKSLAESEESLAMEKSVTEAVFALKLESKDVSGSQKYLFRRDKHQDVCPPRPFLDDEKTADDEKAPLPPPT